MQAVDEMNEKDVGTDGDTPQKLFVGRAQKKAERMAELRHRFEEAKNERLQRYQVSNDCRSQVMLVDARVSICTSRILTMALMTTSSAKSSRNSATSAAPR